MSLRSPAVDFLLRGDLLALSKLDYEELREAMLSVLSDRQPSYTRHTADDPGVAIVEAFAACLDVIAFYHDRTLTESKLGTAQLAESAARLAAVIGYRPSPSVAAGAWQFFEAASAGSVEQDVRVSGRGGDPPENVVFATRTRVDILPALNDMPLSPLLTRQAGAQRVLLTAKPAAPPAPPAATDAGSGPELLLVEATSDAGTSHGKLGAHRLGGGQGARVNRGEATTQPDFRPGSVAMIVGDVALELASVVESRRGGIALGEPLLRSYDASRTDVARATQVRHLRFWRYLREDDKGPDDLVVFEVTDRPILGVPDPADGATVTSTLELHVFEKPDVPKPDDWDPKTAWTKVVDFSASEASDHHYRTFVDDRLTTYVILRKKLGYRELLSEDVLSRVYVRFVSAIGRAATDGASSPVLLDVSRNTVQLDKDYFQTSLVRPKVEGQTFQNRAGWAVTKDDMGLAAGAQVAILGGDSGDPHFRTLAAAQGRYLSWQGLTKDDDPAEAHDPIDDTFDAAKTTIARLDDVSHGPPYPLLEAFYRQAQVRTPGDDVVLAKGTTFLWLEDGSGAKVGDYLLVGCRWLTEAAPGDTRWDSAEVAQIVAVQGNLVQLKDPIEQDYAPAEGMELVVVPRVASVYYGDYFIRKVQLSSKRTFVSAGPAPTLSAVAVPLLPTIDSAADLRKELGLSDLAPKDMLGRLFLAVAGKVQAVVDPSWRFDFCIPARGLTAAEVDGLSLAGRTLALAPGQPTTDQAGNLRFEVTSGGDAAAVRDRTPAQPLVVTVKQQSSPVWRPREQSSGQPVQPGELRALSLPGWCFVPGESPRIVEALFRRGGFIYFETGVHPCTLVQSEDGAPTMFHIDGLGPDDPSPDAKPPIDALAVSVERTFPVRDLGWSADWSLPVAEDTFPRSAVWLPLATQGVIDVAHGGARTALDFTKAEDGTLVVRDAPISVGQPNAAGPLAGADQVWVLPKSPRESDLSVPVTAMDAVWRFPVGADAARAPEQWSQWVVATTPSGSVVLGATRLERAGESVSLSAWIHADGLDLRGTTAFHALASEPVTAKAQVALRLDGAFTADAPQDATGSVAYTLKREPLAVKHAPFWWDDETKALRIFPVLSTIERQLGTQVFHQIVEVNPTAVVVHPPADGPPTRRDFDVPADWPEGRTPAQLLLVTRASDGRDEIVPAEVHVNGAQGSFVVGDRNVPASWKTVKLVRNDWSGTSERSATVEHLVRVDGAPPAPWVLGARLSVLFATLGKQAPPVTQLPEGVSPIEAVLHDEHGSYLLAPADPARRFPEGGEKHCYLAPYSAAGVAPQGTTSMRVPALPDSVEGLRVVGIEGKAGVAVFPIIALGHEGDAWRVEIGAAGPESIGDHTAGAIKVRFAYDFSRQGTTGKCLLMRAQLKPDDLTSAGVSSGHEVNRVVLHTDNVTGFPLPFALGRATGQIKLPIDDVTRVFDADGNPVFTSLSFAQLWPGLDETHLVKKGLLVALGPATVGAAPLSLGEGDTLLLGDDKPVVASVSVVSPGVYSLGFQALPSVVRLHGLAASRVDLSIGVKFKDPPADQGQAPWLLTFAKDADPTKPISDTLLMPSGESALQDGVRRVPLTPAALDHIRDNEGKPLYCYQNQRAQIGDLYLATFAGIKPTDNLLTGNGPIHVLVARTDAASFPIVNPPKPNILLCSTEEPLTTGNYFESATGAPTRYDLTIPVLSQSIAFSSGDFIPVMGTLPARDDKIIRTALRVSVKDANDQRLSVSYRADLSTLLETLTSAPDGLASLAAEKAKGPLRFYSFNKAPGGAFTLNFLLIEEDLPEKPIVEVCVEFGAAPKTDNPDDQTYRGETAIRPIDLTKQLFLSDTAGLQRDKYLFLHTSSGIFWTRVTGVTGAIVEVDPPLSPFKDTVLLADKEAFRKYLVYGYAKPASPAPIDKDYYALAKSTLVGWQLPLGDRLPLNHVGGAAVVNTLVPGDRLLIWDDVRRSAWFAQRTGASGSESWPEWPDYQYEAVIKRIDRDSGLVVLTEPLPARFLVSFQSTPVPGSVPARSTLDPKPLNLTVLPYYGAPFQGTRTWIPLGVGDKGRRFARYTGTLDQATRVGTIPLDTPQTFASNVEVLAVDPLSGEWSRWTQFASIDDAQKKDRAVVVGVDVSAIGKRAVPFSASFGDGKKGQVLPNGDRDGNPNVFARATDVGDLAAHLPARRPLRVLGDVKTAAVPFTTPRCAKIAPQNLYFEIETGGHWIASLPPGDQPWRPALEVEIDVGTPKRTVLLREIDVDEQSMGKDGLRVAPVRPGVVGVYVYTADPLTATKGAVRAYEVPDAGVWAVDAALYGELEASDLTRAPGATTLQLLETESLEPHSALAFSLGDASPDEIVSVATVDHDHWMVTLDDALSRAYVIGESTVHGNLTRVVQGQSESLTLGNGDGATLGLRLRVYNRAPMLFRDDGTGGDPVPMIQVQVDGKPWSRVDDLHDAGPRDRVYRVDVDADGTVYVNFGDGIEGAVPGPGVNNITAVVRTGKGDIGNVASIDKLLDGNLAVKSTRSIGGASGGHLGDDAAGTRERILSRGATLDRIVSVDDAARVATEVGEVMHARVDPTAPRRTLRLVVALVGLAALTDGVKATTKARVEERLPATAGVSVEIVGATQTPVMVDVQITASADSVAADVLAALRRAFAAAPGGFFAQDRWPIGVPLRLGDLYEQIYAVTGVAAARVVQLTKDEPGTPVRVCEVVDPGPGGVIRCDDGGGKITFKTAVGGAS